jgi:hypothetical protein
MLIFTMFFLSSFYLIPSQVAHILGTNKTEDKNITAEQVKAIPLLKEKLKEEKKMYT